VISPGGVRWGVASRILWAWIFTIPASATISAIVYFIARAAGI
jgi:PiT family inorganic phosphate transporter